jgi:hypothetical protein
MKNKNYLAHITMPFKYDASSNIAGDTMAGSILEALKNGLPNQIQADFQFTECMVEGNAFYDSMDMAEWEPPLKSVDQLPEGTIQLQIVAIYDIMEDSDVVNTGKRGEVRITCLDEQNEDIEWDEDVQWYRDFQERFAKHVPYSCSEKVPFHYVQRMLIGYDYQSEMARAILMDGFTITTPCEEFKNPNLLYCTEE